MYPPPGQPMPPFQPVPPPRRASGMGTAALVLGIIAVVFGFVPGLLYIGFILAVLAVVFGIVSLRRQQGRGVAGTVLGGVGLVLSLFFGFAYSGLSSSPGVDAADQPVANSTPLPSSATSVRVPDLVGLTMSEAAAKLQDAGLNVAAPGASDGDEVATQTPAAGASAHSGDTVTLAAAAEIGTAASSPAPAGTKFAMSSWGHADSEAPDYNIWFDGYNDNYVPADSWDAPDSGKKYVTVVVHIEALNAGVSAGLQTIDIALTDANGNLYDETYASGVDDIPSVSLGKGQSTKGTLVFEVPNTVSGGVLSFADASVFVKTN